LRTIGSGFWTCIAALTHPSAAKSIAVMVEYGMLRSASRIEFAR
jgi:hypothetical protein